MTDQSPPSLHVVSDDPPALTPASFGFQVAGLDPDAGPAADLCAPSPSPLFCSRTLVALDQLEAAATRLRAMDSLLGSELVLLARELAGTLDADLSQVEAHLTALRLQGDVRADALLRSERQRAEVVRTLGLRTEELRSAQDDVKRLDDRLRASAQAQVPASEPDAPTTSGSPEEPKGIWVSWGATAMRARRFFPRAYGTGTRADGSRYLQGAAPGFSWSPADRPLFARTPRELDALEATLAAEEQG